MDCFDPGRRHTLLRSRFVLAGQPVRLPGRHDRRFDPGLGLPRAERVCQERHDAVPHDRPGHGAWPGADLPAGHRQRDDVLRKTEIPGHGHCRVRFRPGDVHICAADGDSD
uniref:(northern house mosquito) hypothetical protein n=1 Tax=Culex pipiens TaxID=7175 RepID=A0A8D8P2S1_CULPI